MWHRGRGAQRESRKGDLAVGTLFLIPGRLSCRGAAVPGAPEQGEMQGDAAVSRHSPSLHLNSQRAKGPHRGLWGEE